MGAQEKRRFGLPVEEERVLSVARGVLRRKVQRLEVVEVVLDLRSVRDRVAHPKEDFFDPPAHERDRVERARSRPTARQRDVHGGGALAALRLGERERLPEPRDALLDLTLGGVRARSVAGSLLRRELAHTREKRGNESFLPAEIAALEGLELRARRDPARRLLAKGVEELRDRVGRRDGARPRRHADCSACFATPTKWRKAGGSVTARSASIFRLMSFPAFFSPSIRRL